MLNSVGGRFVLGSRSDEVHRQFFCFSPPQSGVMVLSTVAIGYTGVIYPVLPLLPPAPNCLVAMGIEPLDLAGQAKRCTACATLWFSSPHGSRAFPGAVPSPRSRDSVERADRFFMDWSVAKRLVSEHAMSDEERAHIRQRDAFAGCADRRRAGPGRRTVHRGDFD
jgi:hypothetical protein